ncbi:hypothetical protein PCLA_18f0141 [Pseudomonas citronellolis]|nr:hypothetical protein PCLA_18f0141 [Pseudomonas citronellolis]
MAALGRVAFRHEGLCFDSKVIGANQNPIAFIRQVRVMGGWGDVGAAVYWVPAFAGMTSENTVPHTRHSRERGTRLHREQRLRWPEGE